MMSARHTIIVDGLTYHYGQRLAIDDVRFSVGHGELFAFVGPNGSGKTTLFRILSTLISPQKGDVVLAGYSVRHQPAAVRWRLGVVFQSPSLDKKLTVDENVAQQAALYGIFGKELKRRRDEVLSKLGLIDRRHDYVEQLSGGLKRRLDLAKSLIHRPLILLLDEPTIGLDPGARSDLWRYLRQLREEDGTTILLTSHLLEEADRADRVGIMNNGQLVIVDTPARLRATLGNDSVSIESDTPDQLCEAINRRWNLNAVLVDYEIRFEAPTSAGWWDDLNREFSGQIKSIKVGKPTLEDVFVKLTGHRFWNQGAESGELAARS